MNIPENAIEAAMAAMLPTIVEADTEAERDNAIFLRKLANAAIQAAATHVYATALDDAAVMCSARAEAIRSNASPKRNPRW